MNLFKELGLVKPTKHETWAANFFASGGTIHSVKRVSLVSRIDSCLIKRVACR